MNQFEYILREIQEHGNLCPEHKSIVQRAMCEHAQRMQDRFPNYNLFTTGTGQSYGLLMEKRIIDSFSDLTKHNGDSAYDAEYGTERIEIKSIKCTRGKSSDYIGSRIVNHTPNDQTKEYRNGSFQQVKPEECDWFIFHLLYGNAERIFVVPAKMFSTSPGKENKEPGKLLLSRQHRSHPYEGQANISTILDVANFFEINCNYNSGTVDKFSFKKMAEEVKSNLDKINWTLSD